MDDQDLRDRVTRAETNIENLKENFEKFQRAGAR